MAQPFTRTLDPQARRLLERVAAARLPAMHTLSAPEARALYRESHRRLDGEPMAVHAAENLTAQTPAAAVPLRLYRPFQVEAGQGAAPCLMYFHGGGWTIGDLDTHDNVCRHLAVHGRCVVVSVGYRLAPEHRFPAALEDADGATRWVIGNAAALGIDPGRMAVGGDSAGGNLAAVVAMLFRDRERASPQGAGGLCYQLLLYPATDLAMGTVSALRLAQGHFLTRDTMLWFRANYLGSDRGSQGGARDWRASPLLASDFSGLPPAYVITAGFDPLLDEGRAYADRLAVAGVPVSYECFEGMIHGFAGMLGIMAAGRHALHRCGQLLQAAFAAAPGGAG